MHPVNTFANSNANMWEEEEEEEEEDDDLLNTHTARYIALSVSHTLGGFWWKKQIWLILKLTFPVY